MVSQETQRNRKEWFSAAKKIVEGSMYEYKAELIQFLDHEIELADRGEKRAEERSVKAKEATALFQKEVYKILSPKEERTTEDLQELYFKKYNKEVSLNKITSAMGVLVKEGKAEKGYVRRGERGGRKLAAYKSIK